ncbi:MAG TPA: AAA family ATPase [Thermomicrobiales bacterium]|nr:AAA family ATPase [Thermomicrobiales bacterium]
MTRVTAADRRVFHCDEMEAVLFVGLQAAGKSTFYRERFFDTHVRINLDMLRTRRREALLLAACLEGQQRFVVDNTSSTAAERARYIAPARAAGFRVVGYYFLPEPRACAARNAARPADRRVPAAAIFGTAKRLEPPAPAEGFDALYAVTLAPGGGFVVAEWPGAAAEA